MIKIIRSSLAIILSLSLLVTCGFCYYLPSVHAADALLSSNALDSFVPYIEDGVVVRVPNLTGASLPNDTSIFTQEDLDTHFVHYSSGSSRVSLPSVYTSVEAPVTNVVGVVLDFESDAPISGAVISANGEELVTTDSNGRFQITNLPDGEYDWVVTADDYMKGSFLNYDVSNAGGSNIYRFYLSRNMEYFSEEKDYDPDSTDLISQDIDAEIIPPSDDTPVLPTVVQKQNPTMTSVPDAYDGVIVRINGVNKPYSRQEYLGYTLKAEHYPSSFFSNYNFTSTQLVQLYCAQALVSNSFLEFQQKIYLRHDGVYDILEGTDHQFDPTVVEEAMLKGVSGVFYTISNQPCTVILYYKPSSSTYKYLNVEWFSACKNKGTIDSPHGWPGVEAKSCSDLFSGKEGHKRGYCQSGGAKRVANGEAAVPSVKYYFTDVDHDFALLVPRPEVIT